MFPPSPLPQSSASSPWSGTSSPTHDHPSPPTPDSCFSPVPAIINPDDFTFHLDLHLGQAVRGSPHKSAITHLPVPSAKTDSCYASVASVKKAQVHRSTSRRENMYDRFESSPSVYPRSTPCASPVAQDAASDDFSWEAAHSTPVTTNEFPDPLRCSLLIHEVSLLVGLTPDDDRLLPKDGDPIVSNPSKQLPGILPLNLTPTKSVASRKQNVTPARPINYSLPSGICPHANSAIPNPHVEKPSSVRSTDLVMPITRHKSARPSLPPQRRQGRVFHFEPSLNNMHSHAADLDETFSHPREPPPKPTLNDPANRCSSLDRLERSLLKLEAHAPGNHRKWQSEGSPFDRVVHQKDRCPSLPPPRRLKKQYSNREDLRHDPSRPAHGRRLSGSVPPQALLHEYVEPRAVPLSGEDPEDITPGSFMDMDIPRKGEASQKRQSAFAGKKKVKSLVTVARRLSQGVIAWGKTLTGSTKSPATARVV